MVNLPYSYSAYGLSISSGIELPNFPSIEQLSTPDICVGHGIDTMHFGDFDHVFELSYRTAPLIASANLEPVDVDLRKVAYRITYWGGIEFVVFDSGAQIRFNYPGTSNPEDIAAVLAGPVLGFAMRLLGVFCLHASAVAIDGHAVALLAPSGGGKSTTAAALAARGHAIVSDEVLALHIERGRVVAQPGLPWLRLCHDSMAALREQGAVLATAPHGEKRIAQLPQPGYPCVARSLPLVAMYTMNSIADVESIGQFSGAAAMMLLLGNTYPDIYYRFHGRHRADELLRARRVLQQVALRGINYPRRLDRLNELCALLERDAREQISERSKRRHDTPASPAT